MAISSKTMASIPSLRNLFALLMGMPFTLASPHTQGYVVQVDQLESPSPPRTVLGTGQACAPNKAN